MQVSRTRAVTAVIAIVAAWYGAGVAVGNAQAPAAPAAAQPPAASNDLQRSVKVYGYDAAATSGATRGEVIYYYKCWNCHNDYTRAAGSPAPTLKDVFKRTQLVTGDPVNDDTVAKQIRNGSPQMPSFGTTLKDADVADLLAYLHNGCCYEETHPPVNPWYRANAQNSPVVPERGNLRGGPSGSVRAAGGDRLEGIMVQLIAPNAVRTTVTTDQDGKYEFPQLLPGCLHPAHRQAARVPALPARRRAGGGRRQARRHRAAASLRDRFPAAHQRRAGAADGRRVGLRTWRAPPRRSRPSAVPAGRAATATTRSCATGSTSAAGG